MEFLAKCNIAPKVIGNIAFRTHMPIEAMKDWQKTRLRDPDWRPYSQPANSSKPALTNEQEQALGERLQRNDINQGKYCPRKLVEVIAKREWK
jgi:hypothetical protein